eukprot:TRINITY_DN6706_c0_g1_i6.p1 TRINITY_DN6706_c0_g1~~TRINITY_DN6706_c0_g1_i6.p1  ORF type:complete len:125 (-),score=18.45 TRINITY_DN6706_c0_g1_i6:169-543(-)
MKDDPVQDWNLGFVLPKDITGDFIRAELVVDVAAGGLRHADLDEKNGEVHYLRNMKWGSAYVFKASAKANEGGSSSGRVHHTVPFHGAFRVFPMPEYERRSIEARCGVFTMAADDETIPHAEVN